MAAVEKVKGMQNYGFKLIKPEEQAIPVNEGEIVKPVAPPGVRLVRALSKIADHDRG